MNDAERRAMKAEQFLKDPTFVEAVELTRNSIHAQIESSDFSQADAREDAYRMLRALTSVIGQLEKQVRAGVQAPAIPTVKRLAEQ